MKDKFISNDGFEIPLHEAKFTFVEENPRFKDSFWTNYTLPIDIEYTRDFISNFGHYSSLNASNLKRYHEGIHLFEGKPRVAKMEIMEFRKNGIKIQIDSGFETLPNFDKKLEDLPLLDLPVNDIYAHANEIVHKKYPETVYNFPKLYTDQYNLDSEEWKYFDSFINNRADYGGGLGKVFHRNRLENDKDVYNKNIIHPLPYLLYVLKVGFANAGFRLEGEILEDEYLKQRLIWSGRNYYKTGEQKEHKITAYHEDFTDTLQNTTGKWTKRVRIAAPGKYRMNISVEGAAGRTSRLTISSSNITLFTHPMHIDRAGKYTHSFEFDVSEQEVEQGGELIFSYIGYHAADAFDNEGKNIGMARIHINPQRIHTADGKVIPYVFNENRVQLSRAMPEMTFGELVTTIKNLRNYDLYFEGNKAIMNIIRLADGNTNELIDFRAFEVDDPLRTFNDKISFNIKFPEHESVELQNIYFDEKGYHLNKKNIPDEATEISINAFCLPLTHFRGAYTAKVFDEASTLMLVYYDGLNTEGNNHATNPPGLMDENLAQHLKSWYMNRLTNYSYKWSFITEKNKIRKYDIRSEIFCYGKRHLIKSWTKRSLSETLYIVEMETETY